MAVGVVVAVVVDVNVAMAGFVFAGWWWRGVLFAFAGWWWRGVLFAFAWWW